MRRRKSAASLFEVLNASREGAAAPGARAVTPGVREGAPVRPTADSPAASPDPRPAGAQGSGASVDSLPGVTAQPVETPSHVVAATGRIPVSLYGNSDAGVGVGGVGGAGLPDLPGVASPWTPTGEGHVPGIWSWLNTLEHARRITLIVFGLVLLLFLCIAFELGRWAGESQVVPTAPPTLGRDPLLYNATPDDAKDFIQNIENEPGHLAGDRVPASANVADFTTPDRDAESMLPMSSPKKWAVLVSTTPSEVGMEDLLTYLDQFAEHLGAEASVVVVPRRGRRSPNYMVVVGRFESRDEATALLARVRRLKAYRGTYFERSVVQLIEFDQ